MRRCSIRTVAGLPLVLVALACLAASGCAWSVGRQPVAVEFARQQRASAGCSVWVLGDVPVLGAGDPRRAVKLVPQADDRWSVRVALPAGVEVHYRYLLRGPELAASPDLTPPSTDTHGATTWLSPTTQTLRVAGLPAPARTVTLHYAGPEAAPVLELAPATATATAPASGTAAGEWRRIPFTREGPGRRAGEQWWRASAHGLPAADGVREPLWRFRIADGAGAPSSDADKPTDYTTALGEAWLQDGALYDYRPAARVSAPRVLKVPEFRGSLPPRPLYVYLPRGYDSHPTRRYPVLYMHDGQNCFAAQPDGPFGQWNADQVATRLIDQGRLRECIIVGVAHGGEQRILEYLPADSTFQGQPGRADATARYYRDEVRPYIDGHYRTLPGPEQRALCGSSMGGVMSLYFACNQPDFARNIAAVSTAFHTTPQLMSRLERQPPRGVRLWLDSGSQGVPGQGDDGLPQTLAVRDALLRAGWVLGPDFQHVIDWGATHSERAWSARLDSILLFLFPAR